MAGAMARGRLPSRPIKKWETTQEAAVAEMREARSEVMHSWHLGLWNSGGVPISQSPSTTHMPPVEVTMLALTARM